MKTITRLTLIVAALAMFSSLAGAADSIRVMILDGQSGGAYHDWPRVTEALKLQLDETGLFDVDVVTSPESDGDFSNFHPDFSLYQAVVFNYDGPSWPENLKASFEQYVRDGGGLVIVHAADNAFPDWVAFNEMIGIGGWRGRDENAGPHWYYEDGKLVPDNSPGSAGSHGNRIPFLIETRDPNHPITSGLPARWMHAADELYANMRGPGTNMHVLATAYSDPENRGTGRDEPMLMVLSYGAGRIFHTMFGHDLAALSCVGAVVTFQRGTEWAATGEVTQAVPADFPTADEVRTREDIAALASEDN